MKLCSHEFLSDSLFSFYMHNTLEGDRGNERREAKILEMRQKEERKQRKSKKWKLSGMD